MPARFSFSLFSSSLFSILRHSRHASFSSLASGGAYGMGQGDVYLLYVFMCLLLSLLFFMYGSFTDAFPPCVLTLHVCVLQG